ncbi:MAG: hypothetical protein HYS13_03755 [Planctomycetia bacterium]|nr:hypothetical protein [Planctomycetia bacterium]
MSTVALAALAAASGCSSWSWETPQPFAAAPVVPNPLVVPYTNPDLVWNQVVDVLDDYFAIAREESPRVGELLTEGRLETHPKVGATVFEPWHGDSVTAYDRYESTLQSIRRTALVKATPVEGGYALHVAVMKELEDVRRPEQSTVGAATFRNDSSLERFAEAAGPGLELRAWIPLGNDVSLEQEILAKLQERFGLCAPPASGVATARR